YTLGPPMLASATVIPPENPPVPPNVDRAMERRRRRRYLPCRRQLGDLGGVELAIVHANVIDRAIDEGGMHAPILVAADHDRAVVVLIREPARLRAQLTLRVEAAVRAPRQRDVNPR